MASVSYRDAGLDLDVYEQTLAGMAPLLRRTHTPRVRDGCIEADCALTGGETAILPDVYAPGDYDLAGFCVGVVEREHIVNGKAIQVGDVVLGLASSGLHSNGYSLARKIAFDVAKHT